MHMEAFFDCRAMRRQHSQSNEALGDIRRLQCVLGKVHTQACSKSSLDVIEEDHFGRTLLELPSQRRLGLDIWSLGEAKLLPCEAKTGPTHR